MGRGRQKAKHTKLARELKYIEIETDYNALQQELTGKSSGSIVKSNEKKKKYDDDEYSLLAEKYAIHDNEE